MYRVLVFESYNDIFADDMYSPMLTFDFSDMDKVKDFISEMVAYGKACIVFEPSDEDIE